MNIFILTFFLVPADMLKNKVCTEIYSSSSCLNQNHIQKTNFRKQTILLNAFLKLVKTIISLVIFTEQQSVTIQGEVGSRKSLFFLSTNKNLLQRYNTHYSFSLLSTSYKPHQILDPKYCVTSSSSTLTGKQTWLLLRTVSFQARTSPQSECSLIFLTKITAAILICLATEGWGERKICTRGAVDSQK